MFYRKLKNLDLSKMQDCLHAVIDQVLPHP